MTKASRTPDVLRLRLACGHVYVLKTYRKMPVPGSQIYCYRCMAVTHIPAEALGEWRWVCVTNSRCGTHHMCGQSCALAVEYGSVHARKYPTHEIWVIDPEGGVIERWYPHDNPLFDVDF